MEDEEMNLVETLKTTVEENQTTHTQGSRKPKHFLPTTPACS